MSKPIFQRRRGEKLGWILVGHFISSAGFPPRARSGTKRKTSGSHKKPPRACPPRPARNRPSVRTARNTTTSAPAIARSRELSPPDKPSENRLTPNTKLIIAAAIWLRVMDDAKQPSDKNRPPTRKMPRYIPPTVPASSAPRLICEMPHDKQARQHRQPHDGVKNNRRREFCRHHLQIAHRRRHQSFKRAGGLFPARTAAS